MLQLAGVRPSEDQTPQAEACATGPDHRKNWKEERLVLDSLGTLQRTHYCGNLRAADADKDVVLMGWVHKRRDLGNLLFIDLRLSLIHI